MKSINVKSTKDLKNTFPELSRTDRFKRKLDQLFELGYEFQIKIADPFRQFTSKKGIGFNSKIIYNGRSMGIKKVSVRNYAVTLNTINSQPDMYRRISKTPCGSVKSNGFSSDLYTVEKFNIESTYWSEICRTIGKLIESELIDVVECSTCSGKGIRSEFLYYADGVCFDCMGIGKWFELKK